jgi:hypothetical protein
MNSNNIQVFAEFAADAPGATTSQAATRPSSPQRQRNARLQRVQLFLKVAPSIQKHLGGQSCNRLIL